MTRAHSCKEQRSVVTTPVRRAFPARATKSSTGGRLSQRPAGTNPRTEQAADIFKPRVQRSPSRSQFDRSPCGQSEIISTSSPSACWFAVRSTVSLVLLFCSCRRCLHVWSSSTCVTFGWWWGFRSSRSSVSMWFMVLPGLSRRIVFGVAPPLMVDGRVLEGSSPSFASVCVGHGFLRCAFRRGVQSDCGRGYGKDPRAL